MKIELSKFPPFPPREKWDFGACPIGERFTCLKYACYARAQEKDPSFADRLPQDWKVKYPQWDKVPYLQIPEHERRAAQPELGNIRKVMADELIARSIPEETFKALNLLNSTGSPLIMRVGNKTLLVLAISDGMSPPTLSEHLEALSKEYLEPKALTTRPEGAGSYPRQFQADLNALSAYILLQSLTPADAYVVTDELLGHPLFSTTQRWLEAKNRGELLIKKTLEDRLDAFLVSERVPSQLE
jgi:DNA-binding transcriptional ArsR family regulator